MLEYNEIVPRKFVVIDDEPYEVLASHVFRKQQRKPVNQTKLKNLFTGRVMERSFGQSEKVDEAEMSTRPIKYLYTNKGEYWFCEVNDASKRFTLKEEVIGDKGGYLKANSLIDMLLFHLDEEEKVVGVKLPVKVDLKVVEAPPSIKGNTAQGGNKLVVLETGASINAPLFVNEGDVLRINTETGEYVERVNK